MAFQDHAICMILMEMLQSTNRKHLPIAGQLKFSYSDLHLQAPQPLPQSSLTIQELKALPRKLFKLMAL